MGELYRLDFQNGKSYIGISQKSATKRFASHAKATRLGVRAPLYEAWRKHGAPRLVLLAVLEDAELAATEIRAIACFGTLVPAGYNISAGGELSPMRHPESKRKVSEKMLVAWQDPDFSARVSAGLRGNSNRKGQRNSAEHNAKVSAALLGKAFTDEHKAALRDAWVRRKAKGLGRPWNKKETA